MRKHLSKLYTANLKTSNLIHTKIVSNKMVMGLCSLFAATYTAQVSANSGKSKKEKKTMKKPITSNSKKNSRKTTNQIPVFLTLNNKDYTTQRGQTQPTKSCLTDKGQQRPKTTKSVKFVNN